MTPPRKPTEAELDAIAALCVSGPMQAEFDPTRETLADARIAIFDKYISDCPGYVGRVAVVVWPGGPELFDVFTLDGRQPSHQSHGQREGGRQ